MMFRPSFKNTGELVGHMKKTTIANRIPKKELKKVWVKRLISLRRFSNAQFIKTKIFQIA
jgi:hypothetical protein